MEGEDIFQQLTEGVPLISARNAIRVIPHNSGLYTIFINDHNNLPSPFGDYLDEKGTTLIYLGKGNSLNERLVEQDLRHQKPSTFFRGLGAILGFRPPAGSLRDKSNQNNYKFTPRDTQTIISWIDEHLQVRWVVLDPEDIAHESALIGKLCPLLNTRHNPEKLPELAELREECRRIACC